MHQLIKSSLARLFKFLPQRSVIVCVTIYSRGALKRFHSLEAPLVVCFKIDQSNKLPADGTEPFKG